MKVLVVYYSMYGHVHRMAEAVFEGVKEVSGAEVELRRVPETLSEEILGKMGALEAQKAFSHVPVATVDELAAADAIIFGTQRLQIKTMVRTGFLLNMLGILIVFLMTWLFGSRLLDIIPGELPPWV